MRLVGTVGGMRLCNEFGSTINLSIRRHWTRVAHDGDSWSILASVWHWVQSRGRHPGHPCDASLLEGVPYLSVLCQGPTRLLGVFDDRGLDRVVPSPLPQVAMSASESVRWTSLPHASSATTPSQPSTCDVRLSGWRDASLAGPTPLAWAPSRTSASETCPMLVCSGEPPRDPMSHAHMHRFAALQVAWHKGSCRRLAALFRLPARSLRHSHPTAIAASRLSTKRSVAATLNGWASQPTWAPPPQPAVRCAHDMSCAQVRHNLAQVKCHCCAHGLSCTWAYKCPINTHVLLMMQDTRLQPKMPRRCQDNRT